MTAGVYLHIPFCKSRCSYCDFATDVYSTSDAVARYVDALCTEIAGFEISGTGSRIPSSRSVDTVYFGGGTPSLLTAEQVGQILETVRSRFEIDPNPEITMEMNPATVTTEALAAYRSLGVNRASFGVQTFDDRALKLLARGHDANDARTTFAMLRDAGFDNISFDLIAGLPGQTFDNWTSNLEEAIALHPEHLSLYLLEIHEGTPLAGQIRSGRRPMPDEDLAASMYESMIDMLEAAGYEHYEISNFARPGLASRHNTKYWSLEPVYGFGVSAHSFDGDTRYANERDTAKYVAMMETYRAAEISRDPIDAASEFLFLGLRLTKGISIDECRERFDIDLIARYERDIERLSTDGLIIIGDGRLKLTRRGMLFSNDVFSVFV